MIWLKNRNSPSTKALTTDNFSDWWWWELSWTYISVCRLSLIGLSGTLTLWIFGNPYKLGRIGTSTIETWKTSRFLKRSYFSFQFYRWITLQMTIRIILKKHIDFGNGISLVQYNSVIPLSADKITILGFVCEDFFINVKDGGFALRRTLTVSEWGLSASTSGNVLIDDSTALIYFSLKTSLEATLKFKPLNNDQFSSVGRVYEDKSTPFCNPMKGMRRPLVLTIWISWCDFVARHKRFLSLGIWYPIKNSPEEPGILKSLRCIL